MGIIVLRMRNWLKIMTELFVNPKIIHTFAGFLTGPCFFMGHVRQAQEIMFNPLVCFSINYNGRKQDSC